MSWYPSESRPGMSNASRPAPTAAPTAPFAPPVPYSHAATPTSSTLGRMPLAPAFAVPIEAEVVSRADFLHVMLRAALGANHLAPVTASSYILDVGCGSGRWVREMAGAFPGARVVGMDIAVPSDGGYGSPGISGTFAISGISGISGASQPGAPRTYAFVEHNALEPFSFVPASFDFTHMRQMASALPVAAWPRVVGEMARVTAFGGWVELVEGDLVRNGGPALETIQRWALQALLPQGLDPRIAPQLPDLLCRLSLTDVQTRMVELPVGSHGGRFGELMAADLLARIEGMRGHIVAARLATADEFTRAQASVRLEMNRNAYVQPFYVVWGRR